MKKVLLLQILLFNFSILFSHFTFGQLADGFDIKKAYQQAKNKGINKTDIEGYVTYLHNDYLSHRGELDHSLQQNSGVYDAGTIRLGGNNSNVNGSFSPNSPQNVYCPNAGFEQSNFANWTGSYGKVATGATGSGFPTYTQTSATIVNPAGNNIGLLNTLNYHTIMTTPATNSIYPNCVGFDSLACKVIGTQTVSEIPVVNPNGAPASVRLNGAISNYRASKLTYNMTLNPNNKNFSISYALVLNNGGHLPNEQPYFSVKITDQNGALVPGCSVYTVTCNSNLTNTASPLYDPKWTNAVTGFNDIMYRKWASYAFDFSNYPSITSVNVEFYVGGCSQSGHWGYAYVDAECSQGGAVASFCAGSNTSVLTAPGGYSSYQWIGPSGPISAANGGNTGTATITPVSAGQVFTCNVATSNGCSSAFQTTVSITTVSITAVGSTPSCPNGSSGTTNVTATGSSSGYSYQWLNSSGAVISTSQTATAVPPGTYSIVVNSPGCGSATSTVIVGNSAPFFYALPASYCGSVAWITQSASGSNYKWYTSAGSIIAGATTQTLTVNGPVAGANYFLAFTTSSGCRDSIKYTLTQVPGGSIYTSNIKSICAGNSNSYAVINLQTSASPVYNYSVTGPSGYSSNLLNTASLKDSLINLSIGTYSVKVFDGQCLYNTTFTVNPFVYSYTLTPPTSTICTSGNTTLTVNFGNTTPSSCGLSSTGGCSSPNQITVGTGGNANTSTTYPSVYGHFYRNARHQMLYTPAELSAAGVLPGKISSISFMVNSIPSGYIGTLPGVVISLKCTPLTTISSSFDNTGLVQVYGATNYTPLVGWNSHPFTTAYEWDGLSSILVDICYTWNGSVNYSYNPIMPSTTTSVARCIYDKDDNAPLCGATGSFPSTSTSRPNTKFGNCGGSNPSAFTYSWSPAAGLSSTNTYTSIASPTVTTVYTVQVNPTGQINCVQAHSSTVAISGIVQPTISSAGPFCDNFAPQQMTANPMGGNWSQALVGTSISPSGIFTPNTSLLGNNKLYYVLTNGPCFKKDSIVVNVVKFVPAALTGTLGPYCIYDPKVNLQAIAQFTGGIWSGAGVSSSSFTPSAAGAGTIIVTYSTDPTPNGLCPDSKNISILVNPKPEANAIPSNIGGCNYPWKVDFSTTTVNTGIASWNFGDGSPNGNGLVVSHNYNIPGTYFATITYTDNVGCKDTTKTVSAVTIYSVPVAAFEPSLDVTTIINSEIVFTNQTSNLLNNLYKWNFGNSDSSSAVSPTYLYNNIGEYLVSLIAVSPDGCQDTAIKKIIVNPEVVMYVPNAFTPGNNDGLNDVFQIFLPPTGVDYSTFSLLIYDRWGELVYSTHDIKESWNGAKNNAGAVLKQDIFVYKISFKDDKKKFYSKTGHVSLLHK